jgi:hypothetical protein
MNQVVTALFTIFLLLVGLVCVTKTEQIQKYLLTARDKDPGNAFNPFPKYIRSRTYLHVTRVIGVGCLLLGLALLLLLARGNIR